MALRVSASGAALIDLTTQATTPVEHSVDMQSRTFLARVPRSLLQPAGSWTVRLAAGLANAAGDGFADVPAERGALPGQPNVYNVAFRTHEQEPPHLNFWSDAAQAAALTRGDVSEFAVEVAWDRLAAGGTAPEPVITGPSTRWYVSSVELGQGVATDDILSTKPQFLGRVQPYAVCLPSSFQPGRMLPLTLLLHSLALGQSQFAAIDPRLLHEVCEGRDSVVVTPLARGPSTWYFDTGELDVWEVWARVAEQLGTDPNRTVISGYSMGGYAAYKLGLTYPQVFSQAVVLAGPPDLRCAAASRRRHSGRPRPGLAVRARGRYLEAAGECPLASLRHRARADRRAGAVRLGRRAGARTRPAGLPAPVYCLSARGPPRLGAAGQVRGPDLPHENRVCGKLIRGTSRSRGTRNWCGPTWVSGRIGCGGCRS